MGSPRKASWKARLLLVLAPVIVLGLGAELVCRAFETETWYSQVEETQLANQQLPHRLNSMKFRDREYQCPAPPKHYRVMFLGDSFTFGSGVRYQKDVFTEILERRLNADKPNPEIRSYDLLNAGIPGLLTDQWVLGLEGPGTRFRPDLVVAVFFVRDGTQLGFRENMFNPVRERMTRWHEDSVLARTSAAWRFFRGRFLALEMSRSYLAAFDEQYLGDDDQTTEWRLAQERLVRMRDYARDRLGASFALVLFPLLFQLDDAHPLLDVYGEIERFAADAGIPSFSLLPAFTGREASELWVSDFDQHPNEEGHVLVADALEEWLRPMLEPGASGR